MDLASLLKTDAIVLRLPAQDKTGLLDTLVDALPLVPDADTTVPELRNGIRAAIHQRELQGSTGTGDRLAFPHARVPGLGTSFAATAP